MLVPPALILFVISGAPGGSPSAPKPVPRLQCVPLPYARAVLQRDGQELATYHFGRDLRRPFVFPVLGPSGRMLTRMGHPHDPESHSHHNSVWVAHTSVNGVSFWDDRGKGRILHQRVLDLQDGDTAASIITASAWTSDTGQVILHEIRRTAVEALPDGEWLLLIDLELDAGTASVTLGKTPFGMLGVRMARSIGVNDGGGTIRNSEGGVNEAQVLWKRARWVDYTGPVADGVVEGITLLDHSSNPNHPTYFHVRDDGWMGSSLTYDAGRTVALGKPLRLRYGLYVHRGAPARAALDAVWKEYSRK